VETSKFAKLHWFYSHATHLISHQQTFPILKIESWYKWTSESVEEMQGENTNPTNPHIFRIVYGMLGQLGTSME